MAGPGNIYDNFRGEAGIPDSPFGAQPGSSASADTLGNSPSSSEPSAPPTAGGPETTTQNGWVWQKVPIYGGLFKDEIIGYEWSPIGKDTTTGGAGEGRNDRLTAATAALSGYLQAASLADARRMEAFDQFKQISEFALPAGATTAPGFEPGGAAHAFASSIGLPQYTPPPIQTAQVNPSALAQQAQIPPEVAQMLAAISAAGG